MTRPGHVLCEFTIDEAESLLARYDDPDHFSPHAASARSRLERAVHVERGPGGSAPAPVLRTCSCGHGLDLHGQDGPMRCLEDECGCTDFRMGAAVERRAAA